MSTVMIVDDQLDSLTALKLLLEIDGYTVFSTTDAQVALRMLDDIEPLVVILDIAMPGMDGLTLAAEILRKKRSSHPVHLVALTGYADAKTRASALARGFCRIFIKPIDYPELKIFLGSLIMPPPLAA